MIRKRSYKRNSINYQIMKSITSDPKQHYSKFIPKPTNFLRKTNKSGIPISLIYSSFKNNFVKTIEEICQPEINLSPKNSIKVGVNSNKNHNSPNFGKVKPIYYAGFLGKISNSFLFHHKNNHNRQFNFTMNLNKILNNYKYDDFWTNINKLHPVFNDHNFRTICHSAKTSDLNFSQYRSRTIK